MPKMFIKQQRMVLFPRTLLAMVTQSYPVQNRSEKRGRESREGKRKEGKQGGKARKLPSTHTHH